MSIDADEYKSTIGVDSLYYALVTLDSAAAYTAGTPAVLAPVAQIAAKPSVSNEAQYADDVPYDTHVGEGATTLELTVTGVPPEVLAEICGKVFDSTTGRVYDVDATPPDVALGFRSQKSNGGYRYYWYLKGKFSVPEEAFSTKTDKPTPQTIKLTFVAVNTVYAHDVGSENKKTKRVWGDTDTTNFSGTSWFTQVQTPSVASPSALALSDSTPDDGASGVSKTADITLVFNNVLADEAENGCVLIKDSDLTVIAGAVTISTDRKTVTINPTASLDGTTDYDVIIGVTDIYGQTLSAVVNFTTAS